MVQEKSAPAKSASRSKTTKAGRTKTVTREKPKDDARKTRATKVVAKTASRATASVKRSPKDEHGLIDLFEHALRDIYYAEKKIYRSLPKMIKAADDEELVAALTTHREETQGHVEILEEVFEHLGLRARGVRCEAIDGILEEADSILDDFAGTLAGDAAIIFSARAVEHYEMGRYSAMIGFADALGLDEVHQRLQVIHDQEVAAEQKIKIIAEASVNEAASEYDSDDDE
jgi:ferritin-like metal-binding protein YciE